LRARRIYNMDIYSFPARARAHSYININLTRAINYASRTTWIPVSNWRLTRRAFRPRCIIGMNLIIVDEMPRTTRIVLQLGIDTMSRWFK